MAYPVVGLAGLYLQLQVNHFLGEVAYLVVSLAVSVYAAVP